MNANYNSINCIKVSVSSKLKRGISAETYQRVAKPQLIAGGPTHPSRRRLSISYNRLPVIADHIIFKAKKRKNLDLVMDALPVGDARTRAAQALQLGDDELYWERKKRWYGCVLSRCQRSTIRYMTLTVSGVNARNRRAKWQRRKV